MAGTVVNDSFAVPLVEHDGSYYLLVHLKDHAIRSFLSVQEGIDSYEGEYNRHHRMSHEGSMSACINAMSFKVAIVPFNSIEEMVSALLDNTPHQDRRIITIRNASGSITGMLADKQKAVRVWEKARKPAMISK